MGTSGSNVDWREWVRTDWARCLNSPAEATQLMVLWCDGTAGKMLRIENREFPTQARPRSGQQETRADRVALDTVRKPSAQGRSFAHTAARGVGLERDKTKSDELRDLRKRCSGLVNQTERLHGRWLDI